MKKYRKKEIVEAVQWFKVGDHPFVFEITERQKDYYPVREGATGFLPSDEVDGAGRFIFPGDYIIKDSRDDIYCYDKELFDKLYEEVKDNEFCDRSCKECEHESEDCVMLENDNNN